MEEKKTLPRKFETRWLGIDYGMARIGVAVSDPTKMIASSLENLLAEKKIDKTVTKLLKFIEEYEKKWGCKIERIIVGMPLMMSGKRGLQADEVHHFIEALKLKTEVSIVPWDERLTTTEALRFLEESSLTRKRRSLVVDKVAAVIILQSYLSAEWIRNDQKRE